MIKGRTDVLEAIDRPSEVGEVNYERWHHWPVNWTAVWVGALASLAAVLLFGLIGIALGAHLLEPEHRVVDLRKLGFGALAFSVFSAFFAFVIGGWITGKIAGILHSEVASLHGAISWLVAVPILMLMAGLGAGSLFGGWYAGISGTPSWAATASAPFERPEPLGPSATDAERAQYRADVAEYHRQVKQWKEDTPKVTRNSALGALTAVLLGLVGSVIGGWLSAGEPMSLTYRRAAPG